MIINFFNFRILICRKPVTEFQSTKEFMAKLKGKGDATTYHPRASYHRA